MKRSQKQLVDPVEIMNTLQHAVMENALLEVVMQPNNCRMYAFFVCNENTFLAQRALHITIPIDYLEQQSFIIGHSVCIRFQLGNVLLELFPRFFGLTHIKDLPCIQLSFPESMSVLRTDDVLKRLRIPSHIELQAFVVKKKQVGTMTRIFDMAGSSLSFLIPMDMPDRDRFLATLPAKGSFITIALHVQQNTEVFELSIHGILENIHDACTPENKQIILCEIVFILASEHHKKRYQLLIEYIEAEWNRSLLTRYDLLSPCIPNKQHQSRMAWLHNNHPDVHRAIHSENVDLITLMLPLWKDHSMILAFLLDAIIKYGQATDYVNAFERIQEVEDCDGADRLMTVLLQSDQINTLLRILPILPENSVYLKKLIQMIAQKAVPDALLVALRVTRNKPIQQNAFVKRLIETGSDEHWVEGLEYVDPQSPDALQIVHQIAGQTKSVSILFRAIFMLKDFQTRAIFPLIGQMVRIGTAENLLTLLKAHVSSIPKVERIISIGIVSRDDVDKMVEALSVVSSGSEAFFMLIFGIVRSGTPGHIKQARQDAGKSPQVRLILEKALLRCTPERSTSLFPNFFRKAESGKQPIQEVDKETAALMTWMESEYTKTMLLINSQNG